MKRKLEIACFKTESAIYAINAGADRIEFCKDYSAGGLTPDIEDFIKLKNLSPIPIFVMIRPRPGNFIYSHEELLIMQMSIQAFCKAGADGFVFGVLTPNNSFDTDANKSLLKYCGGKPCTFHKAFDRINKPEIAIGRIAAAGFKYVLSSGNELTALQGATFLNNMKKIAGKKISFIAGGGVRSDNISQLIQIFNTEYYHSAAITNSSDVANPEEIAKIKQLLS
jgi:copper homeostasis protein